MMPTRIHILGASGAGTTTLGQALARSLRCPHLDTDDYYWAATDPPFQQKREAEERRRLLLDALARSESWALSGSLCGWGDVAISQFTLVVFLWIPSDLRLERLREREKRRYGTAIQPGGPMHSASTHFLEWAARYDAGDLEGRSRQRHETWLSALPCPIIRIETDLPVLDKVRLVTRGLAPDAGCDSRP